MPSRSISFRSVTLILITLLLTSILLLQWWSITRFSESIAKQVGASAFEVSKATAETLIFKRPEISIQTFSHNLSGSKISKTMLNQAFTEIRQDVFIELKNEKKDKSILLNADGSVYQIPIPRTGIHQALDNFSNNVLYSTLALLVIGIIIAIYLTHKLASPLKKLQSASLALGQGKLGTQIAKTPQWQGSEIDITIDSFNKMSQKIAELQKQNEALQYKAHLAELAEISRGLAHTIRNPLNTLNLAIDQIASETKAEQKQSLIKIAKHQVSRIDNWVRSLMDLMVSDNQLIKPIDLVKIIEQIIHDLKLSNSQGIEFNWLPPAKPAKVLAIEAELKSLLQSLIVNAMEASAEGSEISISLTTKGTSQIISIVDQGKGFSEKVLNRLFTPHNTDKTYGAGMGLYLAERIVRYQYQGKIEVKGNIPKGSCVNVELNDRGEATE